MGYFNRLIGNDETKTRLANAITSDSLAHAFLISGPSGSGKSTLALELSAALNCEKANGSPHTPCGVCNNCRRIYEGNFPDLKFLEKPKDKATIGVEAVKDFREDMFLSSTEAERKIYVIDNADCMTVEAQNALLKILEEPPSNVLLILLANECDRILSTIKSRVQYIAMSRFSNEELKKHLLSTDVAAISMSRDMPERFNGIIISADGRIGEAKRLLDPKFSEENDEKRAEVISIITAMGQRTSYAAIYEAVFSLPQKRTELAVSLERLITSLRDLIVIKFSKDAKLLFFTSAENAKELCGDISTKRLLEAYDATSYALDLCNKNANVQNILSDLSAKFKILTQH